MAKSRISLEEITETARRLFSANGYESTTLAMVAAELNVTTAALYYWVPNKETLLCAIHEQVLDLFIARCEEVLETEKDEITALAQIMRMHTLTVIENFDGVTSFFRDERSLPAEHAERITKKKNDYDRRLEKLLTAGQRKGTIRDDVNARLMICSLLAMPNWLTHWYNPKGRISTSQATDQITALALGAIAVPSN